ncbi:MAG: hypothetical protein MUF71_18820 [Candidatus Kapabacteria bacterium]|jgi:hypothetical protein|nr:hypothetical protein [Candidatus Kapabacteria bacterium]
MNSLLLKRASKIALCVSVLLMATLETFAQLNIPLPNFPSRSRTGAAKPKPKSAADLLKEEANKPPEKQINPENETESMLNDFLGYYSHGWLPTPFSTQSLYFLSSGAWIINDANSISFPSLPRINGRFSPVNPYSSDDDRKPRPRLSSNSADTSRSGDYYNSEYDDIMLVYELGLPVPLMLRLGIGYAYQRGVLFAKDRSFNGLSGDNSGRLIPLQEFHTLDMQEHYVMGIAGVKIPIYGAFADLFDQRISSYYYLYLGAQAQYNVFNRAIHHSQLIQPGSEFRYGTRNGIPNGTDTLQLWNAPMTTLPQWRIQPEIAFGWGLSGEASIFGNQFGAAALMEVFGVLPMQTVTTDAAWRQYIVGFRFAIGWHRRIGK